MGFEPLTQGSSDHCFEMNLSNLLFFLNGSIDIRIFKQVPIYIRIFKQVLKYFTTEQQRPLQTCSPPAEASIRVSNVKVIQFIEE
jgi:hypothetical protein